MHKSAANTASLGKKGEDLAVFTLETAGMKIQARNFRSKYGEIDIIALDGETIVFAEVKSWSAYDLEDLRYAINYKKQDKIIKTAKYFLSINRKYSNMAIRFDVVFIKDNVSSDCKVTHLASAFTESV